MPLNLPVPKTFEPYKEVKLPQKIKNQIDSQLDQKMAEFKHMIQQQITNIQIDIIRQFTEQESQIEDLCQYKFWNIQ